MSTACVTVVDYGVGNLYSVCRALEHCGASVAMATTAAEVEGAERLLLPGVGAFGDGMAGLRACGLVESIRRFATAGKPLLGICLGMQMLASSSEEFGVHDGLGLIPGRVRPVPDHDVDGRRQKLPHTGWTALHCPSGCDWIGSPLEGTAERTAVYVVHSFAVEPEDQVHRLADCDYGGHRICAAVRRDRVFGCQFHPEKSGPAGLAILRRFLEC
jgi:glutamine amidotransferase